MDALEVLAEMIRSEERFLVALAKLVSLLQMSNTLIPVLLGSHLAPLDPEGIPRTVKVLSTVPTRVSLTWKARRLVEHEVGAVQR
jgi:hypothetical protein